MDGRGDLETIREGAEEYEQILPDWLRRAWSVRRSYVEVQQRYTDGLLSEITPHRYNYTRGFEEPLSKIMVLRGALSNAEVEYLEKNIVSTAINMGLGPSSTNPKNKRSTITFASSDFSMLGYNWGAGTPQNPLLPADIILQSFVERICWRFRMACAALGCVRRGNEASEGEGEGERGGGSSQSTGNTENKGRWNWGSDDYGVNDWWSNNKKDATNNPFSQSPLNSLFSNFNKPKSPHSSSSSNPNSTQIAKQGPSQLSQLSESNYNLNDLPHGLKNLRTSLEETRAEGIRTQKLLKNLPSDGLYDLAAKLEGPIKGEILGGTEQLPLDKTLLNALSEGEFSFSKTGDGARRPTKTATTRRTSFDLFHANLNFKSNEQSINWHSDDEPSLHVCTPILSFGPSNRVITFKTKKDDKTCHIVVGPNDAYVIGPGVQILTRHKVNYSFKEGESLGI